MDLIEYNDKAVGRNELKLVDMLEGEELYKGLLRNEELRRKT